MAPLRSLKAAQACYPAPAQSSLAAAAWPAGLRSLVVGTPADLHEPVVRSLVGGGIGLQGAVLRSLVVRLLALHEPVLQDLVGGLLALHVAVLRSPVGA